MSAVVDFEQTTGQPDVRHDTQAVRDTEPIPLVIVEGFLGGIGQVVGGNFEYYLNGEGKIAENTGRTVIFAGVGPVSSLHDRACELFYLLIGGQVDYGATHSCLHKHARYGRAHEAGLYPGWSAARPLHFLGHSIGGLTIVRLQHLLRERFFGQEYGPDMLKSLTTVCSPFRGTQLVYTLGERTDAAPSVRPFSVGSALTKGIHLLCYLSPLTSPLLDLRAESRALSFRELSLTSLLRQLWRSDWAESRDALPFDVTFEAADEREGRGEGGLCEGTFYRSYVACMTQKSNWTTNSHTPTISHIISAPLYLTSRIMGSFDFSTIRPIPSFLLRHEADVYDTSKQSPGADVECDAQTSNTASTLGEEYWANDGVVPVFSQWHPFRCRDTHCLHHPTQPKTAPEPLVQHPPSQLKTTTSATTHSPIPPPPNLKSPNSEPRPGIWNVHHLEGTTHVSIMPFWTGSRLQREFWSEYGDWLRNVETTTAR
ncbi:alpha/beta-hydrolase [Stereum hirsutum FP-91666 SS1]|uniref:alpha/beta-hydrolase n=1 Tax=Stereum hirsutum (strain FP-91666) TaxID=721885 RepID=UPI000440BE63|nr:alpha/beta-hydrolase [Stereum hirsutum FP-91666 SS1]EIM92237.1 alpha/beta-hydrolase [Stereum hirsutum FP-91666 SS1]